MGNVVVTGASTGIGRATVARLVGHGHTVFAGVRKQSDADSLAAEVRGVVPLLLDVTDADQVAAAAATVGDAVGSEGLHGLVNNAGVAVGGPLEGVPLDELRRQLEVNVTAQVGMTQAFLPLVRQATGRIVFTGSASGRAGIALIGPYTASKYAIEGLAESWRAELAPWGIKVIVVEPGPIKTPIWDKAHDEMDGVAESLSPEARELYAGHLAKIPKFVRRQKLTAISAKRVAKVIEKALFTERPRARYLVGPQARGLGVLARVAPDGAKAAVVGVSTGARMPKR